MRWWSSYNWRKMKRMLEMGGTVIVKPVGEKSLLLGDSIVRNVGTVKPNMGFECFLGN